jgi:hypothetical protein
MKRTLPSSVRSRLILVATTAVVGITCLWAEAQKRADAASSFEVHPQVFSLMECWDSDTESPVATEINLDAVEKNHNQFDNEKVKLEDGWTVFREADAKGFKRYRVIETKNNHYKVEYQNNGGGTLTTSSIIGFSVVTREIRKNDKPTLVRVLRFDSYSSNAKTQG